MKLKVLTGPCVNVFLGSRSPCHPSEVDLNRIFLPVLEEGSVDFGATGHVVLLVEVEMVVVVEEDVHLLELFHLLAHGRLRGVK